MPPVIALIVLVGGILVLTERYLRRQSVPRYVHRIALALGLVSAAILWRVGALHAGILVSAVIILVPPIAVYFFYGQFDAARASYNSAAADENADHHDRDV